jgi:tetratricopeptide (TPR) repeat protein/predicted Ser/Thr protein kinase
VPDDDALDPGAATLGPREPELGSSGSASDREAPRARASAVASASREAPQRLGRYVVLGVLGRGGMGVVHEARDVQVNRAVALKLLHAGIRGRRAERLRREARALARLSHPNVVQVYEVGHEGDCWFIAMELVPGRTLRDWQRERPSWRECVRTYLQAGRGLAAAHAAGITHRDFKPSNCILDERGRVHVVDFGLARQAEDASADPLSSDPSYASDEPVIGSLTRTGEVLGTLGYMPLEQLEGKPADARSDQWSFCASLYEALYGERPFAADAVGALTLALMSEEIGPAPKGSGVPRRLRRALLRGLAKRPEARWPSMDALLAELDVIVGARRTRWALAAGGLLVAGVSLGLVLSEPATPTIEAPIDAPGSHALAEDGRPPSPAAAELRAHAEVEYAAHRSSGLHAHLERIAPGESLPDDRALAAEVLLWRGRIAKSGESAEAFLRRAYTLAQEADVPSIEARAAGAMTGNAFGAHAEGVNEWMRLAWVAVERTPWDRGAAIEVAITAAQSSAQTWPITGNKAHARSMLEFADSTVGAVELGDDAFVAYLLMRLAYGWRHVGQLDRALHWGLAARSLLVATAGRSHPLWPELNEEIALDIHPDAHFSYCEEALEYFDEALMGFVEQGYGEGEARVRVAIGECLQQLGQPEAALVHVQQATAHWAREAPLTLIEQQAHLLAGNLLTELGRPEEARVELERVLSLVDLESAAQMYRERAKAALEALGPPAGARGAARDR